MNTLEFSKGLVYGTIVNTKDGVKQTYGYTFKNKVKNGKPTLWCLLLKFIMVRHKNNGVTKKECQEYINAINRNELNSNHDLFAALKNCGILYWKRHGKKTLWYANESDAKELMSLAKKN